MADVAQGGGAPSMAPTGTGEQAMEIDGLRKEVNTTREALAGGPPVPESRTALPKGALRQCEPFSGKGKSQFADWRATFEAYQSALGTPKTLWAAALLTFIVAPALTVLRAQFPHTLYTVQYEQLIAALETAQLGKHETDFTLRADLARMRLKRGKGGRYNVSQLVHEFDAKLLLCKAPVDSVTACHWFLEALPASFRSRVATDAAGQPWQSLEALRNYCLAVADAWERESAHQDPSTVSSLDRNPHKRGRFLESPPKGEKGSRGPADHARKASFVPGRSPAELNSMRKRGLCFKCGQSGHKAQSCTSK